MGEGGGAFLSFMNFFPVNLQCSNFFVVFFNLFLYVTRSCLNSFSFDFHLQDFSFLPWPTPSRSLHDDFFEFDAVDVTVNEAVVMAGDRWDVDRIISQIDVFGRAPAKQLKPWHGQPQGSKLLYRKSFKSGHCDICFFSKNTIFEWFLKKVYVVLVVLSRRKNS